MKKQRTRKLLAFIITAAMMVMMMSTFVSAAAYKYTPIGGPSDLKLKKVIILPEETPVPEAGFSFEVTAGEAMDSDSTATTTATKFAIKPGII